jgi:hypothetical protein
VSVVIGALDLVLVVMAIDVLHVGPGWVGYLNTAYGAGAVLLGSASAFLVGRRLGPIVGLTALVLGTPLAATAAVGLTGVLALLALVGGSRLLFDTAVRVLLQRTIAPEVIGRVFGLAEGLSMAGLALGCALAPALVSLGGARLALVGTACLLPVVVLACARGLLLLDQHAQVPVVEISLLRQLSMFQVLPPAALGELARVLERVSFDAGSELVREGTSGDCYYAIVEGTVEVRRHGRPIAVLQRGDGLGEIALLRSVPRTATAVAATHVVTYRLARSAFLAAVNGHVPTLESADRLVRDVQARDAIRDQRPPPE